MMGTDKRVRGYWSTRDLCKRFRCTARTLDRWRKRKDHPLPEPKMAAIGSQNRWAIDDIVDWENSLDPEERHEEELSGTNAA